MRKYFYLIIPVSFFMFGCGQAGVNDPGSEYVPDMVHSIAYEANYYDYYKKNTWGSKRDLYRMAQPRTPINGTIPIGMRKMAKTATSMQVEKNGFVPFYYGNTVEERARASSEILMNPLPITNENLEKGKELFVVYCGICHGKKGDGNGFLVSDDNPNAKYPSQPANFLMDNYSSKSNGAYYFAIMHGINVMGDYKDKLSYNERWQVIHYIRSLQAKKNGKIYSSKENTFTEWDIPASLFSKGVRRLGPDGKFTFVDGSISSSLDRTVNGFMDINSTSTIVTGEHVGIQTVEGEANKKKKTFIEKVKKVVKDVKGKLKKKKDNH